MEWHCNGLLCVDVPLRNCSLTHVRTAGVYRVHLHEDTSDVVAKHDINQHSYADDNQLYISCFPSDAARARQRLSECTAEIVLWCT